MEFPWLQFISLLFISVLGSSAILYWVNFSSTDSAVRRLKADIEQAKTLQTDLSQKLKTAEEELNKKQAEAKALTEKMRSDAEEASKHEREKIIAKAREEGEEIIAKAQGAKAKMKEELEKENDTRVVSFGMQMLNDILSQKAKGALDEILINEFIENLKNIDMSRLSPDVTTAEIITLTGLQENTKTHLSSILKEKLKRDLAIKSTLDPNLGGGAILKFGSMALDGSIKNLIRESGNVLKEKVSQR